MKRRAETCVSEAVPRHVLPTAVMMLFLGCALQTPSRGDVEDGVGHARFELRVRQTDVLPVDVFFPAGEDGRVRGAALPAFVYIQGGNVAAADYQFLARALASRGRVVAIPDVRSRLAIFSVDDGAFARELLVNPPPGSVLEGAVNAEDIAVGGHSLGGVVAAKVALKGGFNALVIHASFADPADEEALSDATLRTLTIAGGRDCSAKVEDVRAARSRLPEGNVFVSLNDVTHYQFTASDDEDTARGCPSSLSLEEAHARIIETTDAFMRGDIAAISAISGAEVE